MSTSAFEEPLVVSGSVSKLVEGQKYVVELTDIVKQDKCVAFRESLRGKTDAAGKSIINKEYALLSPDLQVFVDNAAPDFWKLTERDIKEGKTEPREKAKFVNRITFQFREPESDVKFLYDAQFEVPSTKLSNFVARATGIIPTGDEGYTWGNLFPKGSKWVAVVNKRGNFMGIDVDTLVKEELAGPVVAAVKGELSDTAKALLEYIKGNMVGKPKSSVFDLFDSKQFGTYTETQKAWTEIQRSGIKISLDGKTFGFE